MASVVRLVGLASVCLMGCPKVWEASTPTPPCDIGLVLDDCVAPPDGPPRWSFVLTNHDNRAWEMRFSFNASLSWRAGGQGHDTWLNPMGGLMDGVGPAPDGHGPRSYFVIEASSSVPLFLEWPAEPVFETHWTDPVEGPSGPRVWKVHIAGGGTSWSNKVGDYIYCQSEYRIDAAVDKGKCTVLEVDRKR